MYVCKHVQENRTTRTCLYNKTHETADIIARTRSKRRCPCPRMTFESSDLSSKMVSSVGIIEHPRR